MQNQQLVRQALRILPERAIDELGLDEDLREWVVVRVNDEITVDLMIAACGVTFAEAKEAFILRAIGGVEQAGADHSSNPELVVMHRVAIAHETQIDLTEFRQLSRASPAETSSETRADSASEKTPLDNQAHPAQCPKRAENLHGGSSCQRAASWRQLCSLAR